MTLVLAVAARDGVVMVADGQATAGHGLATRTPARKLSDLHGRVAYGCAGSAGLRQRVVESLQSNITAKDCGKEIAALRPKLRNAVNAVQQEAANEHVALHFSSVAEGIHVLFAGVSDTGTPWIYEMTDEGVDEVHHKAEAIGSGRPYARYALMSAEHYKLRERGLSQARVLAYRAVDDAIRTDATALGEPIGVYVVTREGARELVDEDLDSVRNAMIAWQGHERDVFGLVGDDDQGTPRTRKPESPAEAPGIEPPPELT